MVFFSSRISPFTSTVILRDKSPRATAVVTSAMFRTCAVRFPAIEFTESVKSFHVPATPGTLACPPSRPSVPTSRATRVTSPANRFSWSTMVLSVSFSCRISPRTSTVILRERSPLAMAVATSAMLRTWPVRLLAMKFTLSVRSFHVPATPGTCAWPPSLPSVPTSRATRVTSPANAFSWSTIVLMVSFSSRISPFTSTVILRDKSPRATAVVTSAMFRTCAVRFPAIAFTESVKSFHVPATPGTTAWPPKLAVRTDFAGHARHFRSERSQLIHHRVDGFFQLQNFAAHVHRDFARKVAAGHGGRHFGDVAHLAGQVAGHRVHRIGQVLPGAGHAGHLRLAAQFSVGADFARHARHFGGENAELLNHGVDDVRRAQEFAFERASVHVQSHGLRQVALRDGGDRARHFRRRTQQVFHQRVDRDFHLAPGALGLVKPGALARSAFLADHLPDALQFLRHLLVGGDDVVERVGDFSGKPDPGSRKAHREIAVAHGLQRRQNHGEVGSARSVAAVGFCSLDCVVKVFGGYVAIDFLHAGLPAEKFLSKHAWRNTVSRTGP